MLPNNAKNTFADKAYCRLENFLFYTRRLTHFVQCMFISKVFLQAVPREQPTKTAHYPPSWSHIDICLQGSQNVTHILVPSIRFRRLTRLLSTANNNNNEKWEMLKSSLQTHQIFKQRSTQALVHATYTTLQKKKKRKNTEMEWAQHAWSFETAWERPSLGTETKDCAEKVKDTWTKSQKMEGGIKLHEPFDKALLIGPLKWKWASAEARTATTMASRWTRK